VARPGRPDRPPCGRCLAPPRPRSRRCQHHNRVDGAVLAGQRWLRRRGVLRRRGRAGRARPGRGGLALAYVPALVAHHHPSPSGTSPTGGRSSSAMPYQWRCCADHGPSSSTERSVPCEVVPPRPWASAWRCCAFPGPGPGVVVCQVTWRRCVKRRTRSMRPSPRLSPLAGPPQRPPSDHAGRGATKRLRSPGSSNAMTAQAWSFPARRRPSTRWLPSSSTSRPSR
jgi:hypothetical protein